MGVVAAIDDAADFQGHENRQDREGGGDRAEPQHVEVEFDRAVGGAHAHHRDDDVGEDDVEDQRGQQAPIEVAVVGGLQFGRSVHCVLISPPGGRCKVTESHARHARS